jgi:hypothetical protein
LTPPIIPKISNSMCVDFGKFLRNIGSTDAVS